ncbi:MAG: PSD1 and planctomycete cytochrome C domain-containing protein [Planctomycetaceae bacterium]
MPRLIPVILVAFAAAASADEAGDVEFFERHVRPILVTHCYECHSEKAQTREGGLLLDRESGWLQGGDSGKALIAGQPEASLIVQAVLYGNEDLQMPPDGRLTDREIQVLKRWVMIGAPGPKTDLGDTEFSKLGDQDALAAAARQHWAFQPVTTVDPPDLNDGVRNRHPIDRFVIAKLKEQHLEPSGQTDDRTLLRRLHYDLTGMPPTMSDVNQFLPAAKKHRPTAIQDVIDRYADTDSSYRPDTKTPHYFPFAFTYRDYVIDAFNSDKPFDQFIKEQLAADLLGFEKSAPEMAALGFLAVGPFANTNAQDAVDDWIDLTTRGLMGLTVACARCHDHKYEPVPTTDYYALHGVFSSVTRRNELDEKSLPKLVHYQPNEQQQADYAKKRAAIDKKIAAAAGKTSGGNNRSVSQKIRETELAELLLFHPGAPAHCMIVQENREPVTSTVFIRGDAANRGPRVPRRFLTVLDASQTPFPKDNSGRLALAERIVSPQNPLTARVYVNRVWGRLIGSHLVETPADLGLQGMPPTHPELLDWLAADFMNNGWSTKHLIRTIVSSRTWQQRSNVRPEAATIDPQNRWLWRANRKPLSIEAIRDTMLSVAGRLDHSVGGRAEQLWGKVPTRRRAIYGYVNRFNPDPTLRSFDFPSRMQTHPGRDESIVAPQALFTMNSPFVVEQAIAMTELSEFLAAPNEEARVAAVFEAAFQRQPSPAEVGRITKFIEQQQRLFESPRKGSKVTNPWPLVTQAVLMSNELIYID